MKNYLHKFAFPSAAIALFITLCINLTFGTTTIFAQGEIDKEPKVDYLQRIYFSGENKEGLVRNMLITLQELEEKQLSPSLSNQFIYLYGIQTNVIKAESACDILDLLAVGIYELDAAAAAKEGVLLPSERAKVKSSDALANLNKVNRSSKALSYTTGNMALVSLLNNSDSYKTLSSASSVTNTVGDVAGAAGQTTQAIKDIGSFGKSLGILKGKDKPCNDVPKKDIAIGDHSLPESLLAEVGTTAAAAYKGQTTIISVSNMSFSTLRTLTELLLENSEVTSVDRTFNQALSTVTVSHSGSTDDLAEWIHDKFNDSIDLIAFEKGKIALASKAK